MELFLLFPIGTLIVSAASFVVFAAPFTWIAWRRPAWSERYRIQPIERNMGREVRRGLRSWAINHAAMGILVCLAWPLLRLSGVHAGPLPALPVIVAQVFVFLVVDDVAYWFLHRAMHTRMLFRRVHRVHHRSRAPMAMLGLEMHPVEFALTAGLAMSLPTLLGVHVVTLWVWIAVRQWQAAEGHSGYEFPWNPSYLIPGYGGVGHHDRHHAEFDCNYAGFLAWFDRLVGTARPGRRIVDLQRELE